MKCPEKFFRSAHMAEPASVELASNSVLDNDEEDLTVYGGEEQKPRYALTLRMHPIYPSLLLLQII